MEMPIRAAEHGLSSWNRFKEKGNVKVDEKTYLAIYMQAYADGIVDRQSLIVERLQKIQAAMNNLFSDYVP